ncbi:MAG: endo-1,4-beta-xylanase [Defluviitaleaceae bacterium]|nr:endo-1,4-beta-xylanase [Defluviitaleaceae bacterium]MCL2275661.1 endo-1,4-beta-xylanase [Defluviitaleaceae bacterium]
MKKIVLLVFLLMLALAFTACGGNGEEAEPDPTPAATPAPTPSPTPTPTPQPTPTPAPVVDIPEEPVETVLYALEGDTVVQGLPQGTAGSGHEVFASTPNLMQSGSPVFTIVEHPSGEGNSIHLSERNQNFYALDIYFPPLNLSFGATYVFRATGRAPAETGMQLGRTDAPWSAYTTTVTPASGEWRLEHTLAANELLEHFLENQRGVRIMTGNAPNAEFYVDSIEVIRIGERGEDAAIIPEWDLQLASLAQAFEQHFLLGNIWNTAARMDSFNTTEAFFHHFNAVTAENNHKVDQIAPNPNTWNFATADLIVDWAEDNDLAMIGHTLVWHSQSPPWLTTVAGSDEPLTRAQAIENMHNYIRTVAGRYAGRMFAWDVVNEAVWGVNQNTWDADPNWRNHMRSAGRGLTTHNQSQWYNAFANGATGDECGSDYIFYAFRFARIYDPFAILYYNDYNDHVPGKRDAIAQMVIQINERWTQDPLYDGRLLIEGIGMQAHYYISGWMSEPHHVRTAIELYITTGARLSITEWDITIAGSRDNPITPTDIQLERQADRFGLLMSWYLEFSDYIERVSLWGMADHWSWRSFSAPLLFDENFQPKPAFFALHEALENAAPPNVSSLIIATEALPAATRDQWYAYQFTAFALDVYEQTGRHNNFVPKTWHVMQGALPEGLRLNARTGVIHGTPTEAGTFTFWVAVNHGAGGTAEEFTLTVR